MRIYLFSALLFCLINCKKEGKTASKNPAKDSVINTEIQKKDSLQTKKIKKEVFNFETELCTNKGYFDANTYSKEEIQNTYKLWFELGGLSLNDPAVFKLEDLQQVRRDKNQLLAKLDKDFTEKKALIQNLKVVNTPYWQNVKTQTAQALVQEYELDKIKIMAYSDPSVLLNSKFKSCSHFARVLNSGDNEIIEEWRKMREQMSKKNGDPQRIMDEFESRLNSSYKKDYAILDLIVFGWGNCANDEIQRPEHDEKMSKQFESLFIKTDSECDEP
ncbi:hypothetical protein VUJ46_12715 [Chryseobacterium sp. MYb264]|uniref:hypothetical protein n=1 Tax=Chryseobacterium sp. MYb264 TaxID=2745153 RepID=UPI002E14A6D7|nr:hypothetical protein VUJ46_12715 [Chryseobacterium sp. MYb264]